VVEGSRIAREEHITDGCIQANGRRGRGEVADYVLVYRGHKLAVIEAKARDKPVTEGLGQAKQYAAKLSARFAIATNGVGIYRCDMKTGAASHLDRYPTPQEMWDAAFAEANAWRERFAAVPFEEKGGAWSVRYYQHTAVNAVLEAIANDEDRILLTMATGTGKTAVAFQIAWKLFHSRWNLKDWRAASRGSAEPTRRPRVLFLADRNILANQAYLAFDPFEEDARARINPAEIRKKGSVPKNASVFFTIFQTFMSGRGAEGKPEPYFGEYPPDFFDLIIIDECHRGGANDESTWRAIMEHFSPAVQLGLTATPRRDVNADTYNYFGDPVYEYSLKEGINDGFLTPFRVKQIQSTIDDYTYTTDDTVIEGDIQVGEHFDESQFNRTIEIDDRERFRVRTFMKMIDQREKTLVFCRTQEHALAVRDMINEVASSRDPLYCVRVTANDGVLGDQHLRTFQDNDKTIPTILTTSQKLSTGVDARNIRNIVLMRPINSMVEFKQIIGRGTRLFDGKYYFTILDFVKAHEHFNDPEWDGPPQPVDSNPCSRCGQSPCACMTPPPVDCKACGQRPCTCPKPPCRTCGQRPCTCERKSRIKVKLSDNSTRRIEHMTATSFWGPDGKPMSSAEFMQRLFGDIPDLFRNESELRSLWSRPDTRRKLMNGLIEKGYGEQQLQEMARLIDAEQSDIYDVLAYVAYTRTPITRHDRVRARRSIILRGYDVNQQEFLAFVLQHYVEQGVSELDDMKLPDLLQLKYNGISDAEQHLGPVAAIRSVFIGFQARLYEEVGAA